MSEPAESSQELPAHLAIAWGLREPGRRGPQRALSLDQIVDAAIALADESGLAGVSMAQVAKRLGFTTMSLYRYVDAKDNLLVLMRDRVIGLPPDAVGGEDWRSALRRWVHALRALSKGHPWWSDVPVSAAFPMPNAIAWIEAALVAMSELSLTSVQKGSVALMLSNQVLAEAKLTQDFSGTADQMAQQMQVLSTLLGEGRFPRVSALMAAGAFADDSLASGMELDFAVEVVLDGVQALADRQADKA